MSHRIPIDPITTALAHLQALDARYADPSLALTMIDAELAESRLTSDS